MIVWTVKIKSMRHKDNVSAFANLMPKMHIHYKYTIYT